MFNSFSNKEILLLITILAEVPHQNKFEVLAPLIFMAEALLYNDKLVPMTISVDFDDLDHQYGHPDHPIKRALSYRFSGNYFPENDHNLSKKAKEDKYTILTLLPSIANAYRLKE